MPFTELPRLRNYQRLLYVDAIERFLKTDIFDREPLNHLTVETQVAKGLAVVGPCGLGDGNDDTDNDNKGVATSVRGEGTKLLASFGPPLLLCFVTWSLGTVAGCSVLGLFWRRSLLGIALGWQ